MRKARADSIRWGLIFHNGGIFLEPDVLMVDDISPILQKLVPCHCAFVQLLNRVCQCSRILR